MAYISWFNQTRTRLKREGVEIKNKKHTYSPVPKGRTWVKGTCPHCGSGNGFVFWDDEDKGVYLLACQRCGKYTTKGGRRKNGVKEHADGKVENSSAGRERCQALTKSGNRCKNKVKDGMHLCGPHCDMQNEGKEVPASAF